MFARVLTVALVAAVAAVAFAQTQPADTPLAVASAPATTASAPASAPTSSPTSRGAVVLKVGNTPITSDQIDRILALLPPVISNDEYAAAVAKGEQPKGIVLEQKTAVAERRLSDLVFRELARVYLDARKAPEVTDEEFANEMKAAAETARNNKVSLEQMLARMGLDEPAIRHEMRVAKFIRDAASVANAEQYIKDHPAYFNGTKVQASHILLECDYNATTEEAMKVIAKLSAIAADIKTGKVSFEDAARKDSICPSREKGGDLGEFTFDRMVPAFSRVAFALKTGEISSLVRTQYGFHIIKVTGRTEGAAQPSPESVEMARRAIVTQIEDDVRAQTLTTCPISKP
jgi:peptidyl-prolyl cis-trans isomerase C